MKSIDYPEANLAIAKDQPQYNTLFAFVDSTRPDFPTFVCYELTEEDIADIVKNKKLWYDQLTFGKPFQPMLIMTKNPFDNPIENAPVPLDENRMNEKDWDECHYMNKQGQINMNGKCIHCGKDWGHHFFSTRQCELDATKKEE